MTSRSAGALPSSPPRAKWPSLRLPFHRCVTVICATAATAALFSLSGGALGQPGGREHVLPLFMSTSNLDQQGFVRVVNHSDEDAAVRIFGVDDAGRRRGPARLTLPALQAIHLNSEDMEQGNAGKRLTDGLGPAEGNWRLHLHSRQDIEPQAYIRTRRDGFLTSMSAVAPEGRMRHRVSIFNPASNYRQRSWLRLVNLSDEPAAVAVTGRDDRGRPGSAGGPVTLTLPANAARAVTSAELENGGDGLEGRLGDGAVKWRLAVSADRPILVMSLMDTPTGHLSNLSAAKADYAGAANVWRLPSAGGDDGYLVATPDGRLYGWLPGEGTVRVADADYDSGAGSLSASGRAYESGVVNVAGLGVSGGSEPFELRAAYRQGDWIKGEYSIAGVSRAFSGRAFAGFGRGADAAALAGQWSAEGLAFTVDGQGRLGGSLDAGGYDCALSGTLAGVNPAFSLYRGAVAVDCSAIALNVELLVAVGDREGEPGGGGSALALAISRDSEIAVGAQATR